MAVITLTTDFGEKDYAAGAVKGSLYAGLEQVDIVDISHQVSPFNLQQGAYILKNAFPYFPKGTIHLIGIDSERTPESAHIAVKLNGHYFICADNGILSLLATEEQPEKIVEITVYPIVNPSFPVVDVFVKAACHLARGGKIEDLGNVRTAYREIKSLVPLVSADGNKITGHVLYVDSYGNVVTNISRDLFQSTGRGRRFELSARNYRFSLVYDRYSGGVNFNIEKQEREDDGKKLALFNAGGYLEIAIYRSNLDTVGGASTLLGLAYRDTICVQFFEEAP